MQATVSNLLDHLPSGLPSEVAETLAATDEIHIERVISRGRKTPSGEWIEQDLHEFRVLIRGEARLQLEGEGTSRRLSAGDYVNLPARTRHRIEWTAADEDTIWLAIHY